MTSEKSQTGCSDATHCSSLFLPGCGVDFVHWIPVASQKEAEPPTVQNETTPVDAVRRARFAVRTTGKQDPSGPRVSGCLVRATKAMVRNKIESWDQLSKLTLYDFKQWRNYGRTTHVELCAVAEANGVTLAEWR